MSNKKETSTISIGFCGALTIAFIVLKLCSVIDWSWWWVLAPLWMPTALITGIGLIALLFVLIKWASTKD
jgi:hypothetical protein